MSLSSSTLSNMEAPLLTERRGDLLILTLNHSAARNPLSGALLEALHEALGTAAASPSLRAVIIAANGPAFCAGHDLSELTDHRTDPDHGKMHFDMLINRCSGLMASIIALPQPVIAAVEGVATAAGCMLVASCDLAIAGRAAQFCTPGVQIGLFCSTPMVPLSRNVSRKHAMEMLLTADRFSAEDAHRFGLVNRVAAEGQALPEALRLAERIARQSPYAIRAGKKAFYHQLEVPLADALTICSRAMADDLMTADAKEGISAFLHKRPAQWDSSDAG